MPILVLPEPEAGDEEMSRCSGMVWHGACPTKVVRIALEVGQELDRWFRIILLPFATDLVSFEVALRGVKI